MIRLFVCDIDGCLAEPYQPFDLEGLQALAQLAAEADDAAGRPAVSLCSGRPYSYVEAMAQALDLTVPVLFESGAGRFDPVAARTAWHPDFDDELAAQLDKIRDWMVDDLFPGTAMSLDHAKRTQAGLVGPDTEEVAEAVTRVRSYIEDEALDLQAYATDVSVDVLSPELTKPYGLRWLTNHLGITLSDVAYIGDSEGDIEALKAVGLAFAPANADDEVKQAVREAGGFVAEASVIDGTLEAYRLTVEQNERAGAPTSAS